MRRSGNTKWKKKKKLKTEQGKMTRVYGRQASLLLVSRLLEITQCYIERMRASAVPFNKERRNGTGQQRTNQDREATRTHNKFNLFLMARGRNAEMTMVLCVGLNWMTMDGVEEDEEEDCVELFLFFALCVCGRMSMMRSWLETNHKLTIMVQCLLGTVDAALCRHKYQRML